MKRDSFGEFRRRERIVFHMSVDRTGRKRNEQGRHKIQLFELSFEGDMLSKQCSEWKKNAPCKGMNVPVSKIKKI